MIKSMTGYSKVSKEIKGYGLVFVEMKAVNGKNLALNFRMPQELSSLEQSLRVLMNRTILRGTVNVNISVDYSSDFIESFAKERIKKINRLSSINGFDKFSQLIFSDLSNYIPVNRRIEAKQADEIRLLASSAIRAFDEFRISEGREIKKDFIKYNAILNNEIKFIKSLSTGSVEKKKKRLYAILKDKGAVFNQEILAYAEKIDISEEISRFSAHLARIKNEESGASMSFILQEMHREANTLSAKSEEIRIIQSVLKIKETIEKIKEQALNVE
ncbi:TPA: hypothetical protein DCW38_03700 [candidate division WOR-3 bacterium]|jgi:uncharacterized protein (TIGR00255 family)|uniref:YicC family protein n=1 Tax=candidate division WOR-3 bacterium TaxID=2052148 RepID=A0A350H9Q0_UNCW3|nr:hypothetical protein [candidate division WOR-3 bacterium]